MLPPYKPSSAKEKQEEVNTCANRKVWDWRNWQRRIRREWKAYQTILMDIRVYNKYLDNIHWQRFFNLVIFPQNPPFYLVNIGMDDKGITFFHTRCTHTILTLFAIPRRHDANETACKLCYQSARGSLIFCLDRLCFIVFLTFDVRCLV